MQLLIILGLILLNGVLAMSEIAVVSARQARLSEMAEAGHPGAAAALRLAQAPNRFLSTVQIGITLIGVLAGAVGGATIGVDLGTWLGERIPALAPSAEALGIALITMLTTYLSLVIGELAPKRIGLQHAEAVAAVVAPPMTAMSRLLAPIVWLLGGSTELVLWALPVKRSAPAAAVTEAEVLHMIQDGIAAGVFDAGEERMVRGVLELDERRVASIITPRQDTVFLTLDDSLEALKQRVIQTPHNYYPACETSLDDAFGVVKAKDLLRPLIDAAPVDLRALAGPALFVPGVAPLSSTLEQMRQGGAALAFVVDEHGGVDGIVTLNDVLSEIVGEIDIVAEPAVVQRQGGGLLIDGGLPLQTLDDVLGERLALPDDEVGRYETLAGFVMARMDRLPQMGDAFSFGGWRFEVIDMDGARIDRVMVDRLPPDADDIQTDEDNT